METKHTPKSWYVCGTGNGQRIIIDETTGANIAVVYDADDAPILAAAPDLLLGCKCALADLEGFMASAGYDATGHPAGKTIDELRTAIAKATETP